MSFKNVLVGDGSGLDCVDFAGGEGATSSKSLESLLRFFVLDEEGDLGTSLL